MDSPSITSSIRKIDFIEVPEDVGESEKDLVRGRIVGHECVDSSRAVSFLVNQHAVAFVNGLPA